MFTTVNTSPIEKRVYQYIAVEVEKRGGYFLQIDVNDSRRLFNLAPSMLYVVLDVLKNKGLIEVAEFGEPGPNRTGRQLYWYGLSDEEWRKRRQLKKEESLNVTDNFDDRTFSGATQQVQRFTTAMEAFSFQTGGMIRSNSDPATTMVDRQAFGTTGDLARNVLQIAESEQNLAAENATLKAQLRKLQAKERKQKQRLVDAAKDGIKDRQLIF